MGNYPAITIGAIGTAVSSVIVLLAAFGVPITSEQTQAILGVVAALSPIVTSLFIYRERAKRGDG